jgi:polyisoprenoid-binding protein YceI
VSVEPAADLAAGHAAAATTWLAPDLIAAGDALPVHVRGQLPTPAHRIAGFTVEKGGPGIGLLRLCPIVADPPPGTVAPQVLQPFDVSAQVVGLAPGRHRITVAAPGAEATDVREVLVLPRGVVASMTQSGGIAGIQRTVSLFDDGRVVTSRGAADSRAALLPADAPLAAARRAVLDLAGFSPPKRRASGGADMFQYDLVWTVDGKPVRAERDDRNLEPELRSFVAALEGLPVEPEPVPRWTIDLAQSFVEVRTGSSGLLSSFGHDHKLMVRRLAGTLAASVEDLANGSVVVEIEAGSLAVVDDDSAKDRAEIEREMNDHVLEVARHPAIRFESRKVEATATLDGAFDLVVHGDLTLHGKTRRIRVPGRLEVRPELLRFRGAVSLLQSEYGIEPTVRRRRHGERRGQGADRRRRHRRPRSAAGALSPLRARSAARRARGRPRRAERRSPAARARARGRSPAARSRSRSRRAPRARPSGRAAGGRSPRARAEEHPGPARARPADRPHPRPGPIDRVVVPRHAEDAGIVLVGRLELPRGDDEAARAARRS